MSEWVSERVGHYTCTIRHETVRDSLVAVVVVVLEVVVVCVLESIYIHQLPLFSTPC